MPDSTHPTLPQTADVKDLKERAAEVLPFQAKKEAAAILSENAPPPEPALRITVDNFQQAQKDLRVATANLKTISIQYRAAQREVSELKTAIYVYNQTIVASLVEKRRSDRGLGPTPAVAGTSGSP